MHLFMQTKQISGKSGHIIGGVWGLDGVLEQRVRSDDALNVAL
jgi:hypothetical protein